MKAQVLHQYASLVARILSLLVVILLFMLSLDSFGGDSSFFSQIVAFLIHNIPTFIALLVTVIGFKQPEVAGFLYLVLAGLYILLVGDKITQTGALFVDSFLLFTGGLFIYQAYLSRLIPSAESPKKSKRRKPKRKRK